MNSEIMPQAKMYCSYDAIYDEVYQTEYGFAFTFSDEDDQDDEEVEFFGYVVDQTAYA